MSGERFGREFGKIDVRLRASCGEELQHESGTVAVIVDVGRIGGVQVAGKNADDGIGGLIDDRPAAKARKRRHPNVEMLLQLGRLDPADTALVNQRGAPELIAAQNNAPIVALF